MANVGVSAGEESSERTKAVEIAYATIKDAIMEGRLREGESLVETDLAQKIGVSRTPIREALKQLRNEGLVILESYKKNYVAHFTEEDLYETVELVAMLEGYAARRAASRLTEEQLNELISLEEHMEDLIASRDSLSAEELEQQWRQLNEQFHELIWNAANSRRVKSLLTRGFAIPFRVLSPYRTRLPKYLERACMYHREIISAFQARDEERAGFQMRAHKLSLLTFQVR